MDLVENDVDTLHEEIEHLVGHLVGNDVDILHEEIIDLNVFYCIRSSQKIAKLIEEKLIFGYIIEVLVIKQIVYVHDLYVNRLKI